MNCPVIQRASEASVEVPAEVLLLGWKKLDAGIAWGLMRYIEPDSSQLWNMSVRKFSKWTETSFIEPAPFSDVFVCIVGKVGDEQY